MDNYDFKLIAQLIEISKEASKEICRIYDQKKPEIHLKGDLSPLTQADTRSHQIITAGLKALTPDVPILSEEALIPPFAERKHWTTYWCVDPLDGTKEFIARTDEFTINIALILNHEPVLGLIALPIQHSYYSAIKGQGAYRESAKGERQRLQTRRWAQNQPLTIAVSRRHRSERLAEQMAGLGPYKVLSMGSALKFCAIAEQRADLYPRFGPTSEWDTAAGHCILNEAGGALVDRQGLALRYNTKEDILNPGFLATGDLGGLKKLIASINKLS